MDPATDLVRFAFMLVIFPDVAVRFIRRKMFREEREVRIEQHSHAVLQSSATAAMPLMGSYRGYIKNTCIVRLSVILTMQNYQ
jgi:hypothetical protein